MRNGHLKEVLVVEGVTHVLEHRLAGGNDDHFGKCAPFVLEVLQHRVELRLYPDLPLSKQTEVK